MATSCSPVLTADALSADLSLRPQEAREATASLPQLSVILPTYNERENLAPLVQRIKAALRRIPVAYEILVVDDCSPDGTACFAQELSNGLPLRVLERKEEKGLARSVLEGFVAARGECLLVMDADLSHPPERIPEMWEQLTRNSCDLVIGSRYVPGGAIRDWTILRRFSSRVSRRLVFPLTRVKDPLSGFFLVRRGAIENRHLRPAGFKILLEILAKGQCEKITEVPITFEERLHGCSKLTSTVILEYFLQVARLYGERAKSFFKSQ
jgi:dolichol-phosphate mannosyltransferase